MARRTGPQRRRDGSPYSEIALMENVQGSPISKYAI
jgi:hypothetical protein